MGLILVVSEDLIEIDTIKAALSVHGWWVTVAADAPTAVQVAADQAPQLVVVDVDVPDSMDLLTTFASENGGPGVVTCVPQGFEGAPELAGRKMLTKPVAQEAVLEAVQRSLAAPRASVDEPATAAQPLLTTEEIFGDVLREIEEGEPSVAAEPPAEAPSAPEPVPTVAPPPAAAAAVDDLFRAEAAPEPTVSLAGLFDDGAEPPEPNVARTAGWQGEERRSADRPWSTAGTELPEPEAAEVLKVPLSEELFAEASAEPAGEVENDGADLESAAAEDRRLPRLALAVGALAATLLVAVGVVLVLNRGAEPVTETPVPVEAAAPPTVPVPRSPLVVETGAPAGSPGSVESASAGAERLASPAPAETTEEMDDLDLQAIVEEELERREAELRRVFLEEEKRLLRELNDLEPVEPAEENGDESDADERSGVGR